MHLLLIAVVFVVLFLAAAAINNTSFSALGQHQIKLAMWSPLVVIVAAYATWFGWRGRRKAIANQSR